MSSIQPDSDKDYTHVFFHKNKKRGVYSRKTGTTKYFEMSDPNFKNPAKLLAILGINVRLFVIISGSDMTVTDMYYVDGNRFFRKEEITKYCTGFGWKYAL